VEQDARRRLDADVGEPLGMLERDLDRLPDVADLLLQAADVVVGDPRR
jgi:hypothetical protein